VASDRQNPPGSAVFDKAALLARHPLFRELKPEIRERLGNYATIKEVARGTTIFVKGDAGTCLFAVCSGTVQVTVASAAGKNAVFNHLGEGEIFGEIALLDGQPRTADAVAFSDCKLMVIERRDFIPLLRGDPDITIKLLEILCSRLRRTSEQVEDLMFLDLKSRLVKTLLRLAQAAKPGGEITMSQNDLSEIVGMSREMINKQLHIWAKDGWIGVQRRRIVVLRPDALARIVAEE
jgi:CRP/FNR family cyclic AMP-dependent transcriptional regulator